MEPDPQRSNICWNCNAPNSESQSFCGSCGANLHQARQAALVSSIDTKKIELDISEAIALRFEKWLKLFGFFIGIPLAIFVLFVTFMGIRTLNDLENKVNLLSDAEEKLKITMENADNIRVKSEATVESTEKILKESSTALKNAQALQEEYDRAISDLRNTELQVADLRKSIAFTSERLVFVGELSELRLWAANSIEALQFIDVIQSNRTSLANLLLYDKSQQSFWESQAKTRRAQAKALELQLSLIVDYMASLSALASGRVADTSIDIAVLTESLKRSGVSSKSTIDANRRLATIFASAASKSWQPEELDTLIEQANPPLQAILGGLLRSIVDRDFRGDLANEAGFLDSYFKRLLRIGGGSETANVALNEWYALRKEENARRIVAVDAYLRVLDKISEGHQRLYDSRNNLGSTKLAAELRRIAANIRSNMIEIIRS
jgi:hypothetical protein